MEELLPSNNPAQEQTLPDERPLPGYLKAVAYGSLAVGPLLAVVNVIIIGNSISKLSAAGEPTALSNGLLINIALFLVLGALLVIGGIGLLRRQRWGHRVSLIAGIFCFVVHFGTFIVTNVLKSLYITGALQYQPRGQFHQVQVVAGVPGFATLYGIVLIVMLLLPESRAWARGKASVALGSPGQFVPGGTAVAARKTSGLAIASLVCSVIPFALLTQIAGLTLGIVALVKIRKSQGTLGGKGFAIAGVIISSLAILFIGGIIAIIGLTGGFK